MSTLRRPKSEADWRDLYRTRRLSDEEIERVVDWLIEDGAYVSMQRSEARRAIAHFNEVLFTRESETT